MALFDPKRLSLPGAPRNQKAPRHRLGEKFLLGPIPWDWLSVAAGLPGRALHVGIALWFLSGIKGRVATVALSNTVLCDLGVNRHAAYRGLAALEAAGLVSVERHRGRNSIVTILPAPDIRRD